MRVLAGAAAGRRLRGGVPLLPATRSGSTTRFGDESSGYASFDTGSGSVAIFERGGQGEVVELRPPGDSTLLVLEVDDVDAAVARLERARRRAAPVDQPEWGGASPTCATRPGT